MLIEQAHKRFESKKLVLIVWPTVHIRARSVLAAIGGLPGVVNGLNNLIEFKDCFFTNFPFFSDT